MSEPQIINTLQNKIYDVERLIASYEEGLRKAQQDLVILKGAYALFQMEGGKPIEFTHGVGVRNLFKRGEVWAICEEALKKAPDGLNTRALAIRCLEARGLDPENAVLRRAMTADVINIMRKRVLRYMATRTQDRERSAVWRLAKSADALSVGRCGELKA